MAPSSFGTLQTAGPQKRSHATIPRGAPPKELPTNNPVGRPLQRPLDADPQKRSRATNLRSRTGCNARQP